MADEVVPAAPAPAPVDPAPAPAPVPAPAVEAAPAPVVEAAPAPAPEAAPAPKELPPGEPELTVSGMPSALEEAKAGDPPKVETKPEEKPAEKPAEVKPEEKKAEEAKPEEKPGEPKVEAPVELAPVEYKYELPEVLVLNDEMRKGLHEAFDNFRKDPANAQPLIDYHVNAVRDLLTSESRRQHATFNDMRREWHDKIKADEEMGGSGYETTVKAVARMRDKFISPHPIGSEEYNRHRQEFDQASRLTGFGDHPAIWRLFHNLARYFDEPQVPTAGAPASQGKAPGRGRAALYTHPSSPQNRNGAG